MKPNMPWNVLPVLEEDGKQLSQSSTILRYLGRKFKLAGADEFQTAKCNEYVDAVTDVNQESMKFYKIQDEIKKAEAKQKIQNEVLPKIYQKLEDILKKNGNGFLVGNGITYADIFVAHFMSNLSKMFETTEKFNTFPLLVTHQGKVFNSPGIKEWIAKRPDTLW